LPKSSLVGEEAAILPVARTNAQARARKRLRGTSTVFGRRRATGPSGSRTVTSPGAGVTGAAAYPAPAGGTERPTRQPRESRDPPSWAAGNVRRSPRAPSDRIPPPSSSMNGPPSSCVTAGTPPGSSSTPRLGTKKAAHKAVNEDRRADDCDVTLAAGRGIRPAMSSAARAPASSRIGASVVKSHWVAVPAKMWMTRVRRKHHVERLPGHYR